MERNISNHPNKGTKTQTAARLGAGVLVFAALIGADNGCKVETQGAGNETSVASSCSAGTPKVASFTKYYNKLPHHTCPKEAQSIARQIIKKHWSNEKEWDAFNWLIGTESSWLPDNIEDDVIGGHPATGACGLVQAYPCTKLYKADTNHDGIINVSEQINWDVAYIKDRYGDPIRAVNYHKANNSY